MTTKMTTKNIAFVIYETPYQDFDVIGIGDRSLLKQLSQENEHYHLIEHSKFGGIAVLILDTAEAIKDANHIIGELNNRMQTNTLMLSCMNTSKRLYKNKQEAVKHIKEL